MPKHFRVTYATLSADNEDLQAAYDEGIRVARSWFGQALPAFVSGQPRTGGAAFDVVSPADQAVLCRVHAGHGRRPRGCRGCRVRRRTRVGRHFLAAADRPAASRGRPYQ